MQRKKWSLWRQRRFLRFWLIGCAVLTGVVFGLNAALGKWWLVALDVLLFTLLFLLYWVNASRYPLCPSCHHLTVGHHLTTPDEFGTWGWMRCHSTEADPDGCDCFGAWSERVKEMNKSAAYRERSG